MNSSKNDEEVWVVIGEFFDVSSETLISKPLGVYSSEQKAEQSLEKHAFSFDRFLIYSFVLDDL